jgi:hypothetical protein
MFDLDAQYGYKNDERKTERFITKNGTRIFKIIAINLFENEAFD